MPYSPVYSAPFIQYTPDTPNGSFAVPAGFTAVVRQISIVQGIGGYSWACNIQDSEAAPELTIAAGTDIGVNVVDAREGRWVVPGGGIISAIASAVGDSVSIYVGGYLLTNIEP
jgi:hypothetical protein